VSFIVCSVKLLLLSGFFRRNFVAIKLHL